MDPEELRKLRETFINIKERLPELDEIPGYNELDESYAFGIEDLFYRDEEIEPVEMSILPEMFNYIAS